MRSFVLLTALLALTAGCARAVLVAPAQYLDPARAPTGNVPVELEVVRAERLGALTDAEWAALEKATRDTDAPAEALSDYVLAGVGRGQLADVATRLQRRAQAMPGDEGRAADVLGLLMSHSRWDLCADAAATLLSDQASAGGFLVRALCFARDAEPEQAAENLHAAMIVGELGDELGARLAEVIAARSSPTELVPMPDAEFESLRQQLDRQGTLARLFLQHVAERFDGGETGTLQIGGLSADEIRVVIGSRATSYRYCVDAQAGEGRKAAAPSGEGLLNVRIGPLGTVEDLTWVQERWGDHPGVPELRQCLQDQVRRLRFPPPRFGRPQQTTYRFAFGS